VGREKIREMGGEGNGEGEEGVSSLIDIQMQKNRPIGVSRA